MGVVLFIIKMSKLLPVENMHYSVTLYDDHFADKMYLVRTCFDIMHRHQHFMWLLITHYYFICTVELSNIYNLFGNMLLFLRAQICRTVTPYDIFDVWIKTLSINLNTPTTPLVLLYYILSEEQHLSIYS